jgi:predicted outer membrane protein
MGKAKLGSWWAAGAAVCLLISAGVAAQGMSGNEAPPAGTGTDSRFNERGGPNQAVLSHLHELNQRAITDAGIATQRSTNSAVRDYAQRLIEERMASDAKLLEYARQEGMNVDVIRGGTVAQPQADLGRTELVISPSNKFDEDFANKMLADRQAAFDVAAKGAALVRGPEIRGLLRDTTATLMREQADAMALVAALPATYPPSLTLPAEPPGVDRSHSGVDTRPGLAP